MPDPTCTAEAVTRALVRTLGYDPTLYDAETVGQPFPGVRLVRRGVGPEQFIKQAHMDRRMRADDFRTAFGQYLEAEAAREKQHDRARKVVGAVMNPLVSLTAWLAVGWKVAAGRR